MSTRCVSAALRLRSEWTDLCPAANLNFHLRVPVGERAAIRVGFSISVWRRKAFGAAAADGERNASDCRGVVTRKEETEIHSTPKLNKRQAPARSRDVADAQPTARSSPLRSLRYEIIASYYYYRWRI